MESDIFSVSICFRYVYWCILPFFLNEDSYLLYILMDLCSFYELHLFKNATIS